jgi:hypothetical protein
VYESPSLLRGRREDHDGLGHRPKWFDEVYDAILQNGVKQGYILSGYDLTDSETGEDVDPMGLPGESEINERFMNKANEDFSRKISKFFGVPVSGIGNTEWYDGPSRMGLFEFPGRLLWA